LQKNVDKNRLKKIMRNIKKKSQFCILLFLCFIQTVFASGALQKTAAESKEAIYYTESWKKGERKIFPRKLTISLDKSNPVFSEVIRDESGCNRYNLVIEPSSSNAKSADIKAWSIEMAEIDGSCCLLLPTNRGTDTISKYNLLGLLYPVENSDWRKTGFFGVPLSAKRIIKIEKFYCVIKVIDYKILQENNQILLNSMNLEIVFTNN
jgi:hypothetical protein